MSIVPEAATLIAHQVLRHNSGNASQESLVFLNNKKLVTASSKACDSFAKELRKDLQLSVCFFAADKDFTHFSNKKLFLFNAHVVFFFADEETTYLLCSL